MNKHAQRLLDATTSQWLLGCGTVASIAGLLLTGWALAAEYGAAGFFTAAWAAVVAQPLAFTGLALLAFGLALSIRVHLNNLALRRMAELFCEINVIYRNKLQELFTVDDSTYSMEELVPHQEAALRAVCQRIQTIFFQAIRRPCMVTVKLIQSEQRGSELYVQTYVRSQELCPRDLPEPQRFKVSKGLNTAFDEAIRARTDGKPRHFFSADLRRIEGRYRNERPSWLQHYKSALVVPIQSSADDADQTLELLGFLCVDSKSVNRLDDHYQLYMLTALAAQMYNFLSLMRGRYTVLVG
jgi:hypothetical protein